VVRPVVSQLIWLAVTAYSPGRGAIQLYFLLLFILEQAVDFFYGIFSLFPSIRRKFSGQSKSGKGSNNNKTYISQSKLGKGSNNSCEKRPDCCYSLFALAFSVNWGSATAGDSIPFDFEPNGILNQDRTLNTWLFKPKENTKEGTIFMLGSST